MLEHHIQKSIVYKLAFSPGLRFSQLKPDELDNKLFDYHLKLVIKAGLVIKDENGLYNLTHVGRRVGVGVLDKHFLALDRAHSVLFLIIRRHSDKAWLLFERQTHPLLGKIGFMHANPTTDKDVFLTASSELLAKTGITATFSYIGNGYFKVYENNEIESYTHFTVLVSEDAKGELCQSNNKGKYLWQENINSIGSELLPTAKLISELYEAGQPFFVEQTFNL
jgi:hypothetical protein